MLRRQGLKEDSGTPIEWCIKTLNVSEKWYGLADNEADVGESGSTRITMFCRCDQCRRVRPRPSTAPGLGVTEWSPEGLHDKSVSLILNTDEILKFVKKKMN